jgi:Ricin-type beta-trefoil lectin domain
MLGRIAGITGALVLGLAPAGFATTAYAASPPPVHGTYSRSQPVAPARAVRPLVSVPASERQEPRDLAAPLAKPTAIWTLNNGIETALAVGRAARVIITDVSSGTGPQWVAGPGRTIRQATGKKLCLNVQGGKLVADALLTVSKCTAARSEQFVINAPYTQSPIFFMKPAANAKLCLSFPLGQSWGFVVLAKCAAVAAQAWSATNLYYVASTFWTPRGALATPAGGKAGPDVRAQPEPSPWASSLSRYWFITFDGSLTWDPAAPPLVHPITNGAQCLALAGKEQAGTAFVLRPCTKAAEPFVAIWMNHNISAISLMVTPDGLYCMRIAGKSGTGYPVILGSCVGDNNDLWAADLNIFNDASARYSSFYPGTGNYPYNALTLTGSGAASKAVIEPANEVASQIWSPVTPTSNRAAIMFRSLSEPRACLTVNGGKYAPGTSIGVSSCSAAADQQFLRAASGASSNPGEYTYDELMPYASGDLCLTVAGGIAVGHAVRLEPCNQNQDQAWSTFNAYFGWGGTPGYFAAYPVNAGPLPSPGPLLAIANETATGAQAVLLSTVKGSPAQMWVQQATNIGSGFSFSPVYDTGWCLTAPAATAGTALVLQACDGSASQSFTALGTGSPEYVQYSVDGSCMAAGPASQGTVPTVVEPCSASDTAELWWGYPAG